MTDPKLYSFAPLARALKEMARIPMVAITQEEMRGLIEAAPPGTRIVMRMPADFDKLLDAYDQPFDDSILGIAFRLESPDFHRMASMEWHRNWLVGVDDGELTSMLQQMFVEAVFAPAIHHNTKNLALVRRSIPVDRGVHTLGREEFVCYVPDDEHLALAADAGVVGTKRIRVIRNQAR